MEKRDKFVVCCQCGKEHLPYAHKEDCSDIDNEIAIEDAKIYPSSNDGVEIYIWYPWCRDCYIDDMGGPASWDDEYLKSLEAKPMI